MLHTAAIAVISPISGVFRSTELRVERVQTDLEAEEIRLIADRRVTSIKSPSH